MNERLSTDTMRAAVLAGGATFTEHQVERLLSDAAGEIDRLRTLVRAVADERQTLLAQLSAERDRLNWLESELAKHGQVTLRSDRWSQSKQRHIGRCKMFSVSTQHIEANDVRAVVDKARGQG